MAHDDPTHDCPAVRESVSAGLDGERAPLTDVEVAGHLDACVACRGFVDGLGDVVRRTRVGAALPVPDLTASVLTELADLPARSAPRRTRDLRMIVAAAGFAQLVLALPLLVGALGAGQHLGRDLAALQLALGIGLLLAALQPRRTAGLLPVVTVVVAVTLVTAGMDLASGAATWSAELTHLAEVVGVAALWALGRELPGPTLVRRAGRSLGRA